MSNSDYAKDNSNKTVRYWSTFLNVAATSFRSKLIPITALSVTETDLFPAGICAQDTLFVMRIFNSMGLKMKLPTKIEIDNKGSKDITHNWPFGGRLRHVELKNIS